MTYLKSHLSQNFEERNLNLPINNYILEINVSQAQLIISPRLKQKLDKFVTCQHCQFCGLFKNQ